MKHEVNKIEVEPRVGSDSESDIVGLVTRHVLSVGDYSQSDCWIVELWCNLPYLLNFRP